MTWDRHLFSVFDDLEQQALGLYAEERDAEVSDLGREEYSRVSLASRLMASVDRPISVEVLGVGALSGTLDRVTGSWCLLRCHPHDWLLPLSAVVSVVGASERSVPEVAWPAIGRLGWRSALTRLVDLGHPCVVHLRNGTHHELVPRRAGADFLEASAIGTDEGSRSAAPMLVPFAALAAVRSLELP